MQKKLFASLLVTIALICACALAAGAVGTLADDGVYEISTAEEMHELATLIAAKGEGYGAARAAKYRLTKDIDMSAVTAMIPIGANAGNAFTGTFDGGGHTISGIHLEPAEGATGNYWGLFGRVAKPAVIQNLTVEGTVTSGGASKTGTVTVGSTQTGTLVIKNCTNAGAISGSKCVGGILGRSDITSGSVTVTGCVNEGAVTATIGDGSGFADVGGIAGFDWSVKAATNHLFENCVNRGAVTFAKLADKDFSGFTKGIGYQGVGGIIGRTQTSGIEVTGCYNGGTVTSDGQDADGNPGINYAMVIVGKSPAAPKNSNNYYKPGTGAMNSVKAIAVDLALVNTSAVIYKDGSATVRYIAKLTVDDSAAVVRYGMLLAQTAAQANVKAAELSDAFEGSETTYAVDLTEIPQTERETPVYAWAYAHLAGGVKITLPMDAVTVSGCIGG